MKDSPNASRTLIPKAGIAPEGIPWLSSMKCPIPRIPGELEIIPALRLRQVLPVTGLADKWSHWDTSVTGEKK